MEEVQRREEAAAARAADDRRREEAREARLRAAEEQAEAEAAAKVAHVTRAAGLVEKLEEARTRGPLRDLDASKAVRKRRLQFKKLVNGRINTLSHDAGKVREVGQAVCEALAAAARDDAAAAAGSDPVAAPPTL